MPSNIQEQYTLYGNLLSGAFDLAILRFEHPRSSAFDHAAAAVLWIRYGDEQTGYGL
jgi:hypothetical protein